MKPIDMKMKIPPRYKPLLIGVIIVCLALAIFFAISVYRASGNGPCCATEFDARPYQQVPARTLP